MLSQLCYVSSATRFMSSPDLTVLLESSRRNNERHAISGMLLYKDRSFIQVLEGEGADLHWVFGRIRGDRRHEKIRLLYEGAIDARDFPGWSMGFHNLDGEDLSGVPGYNDIMQSPLSARALFENPTRAKKLLLLFRAHS